MKRCCRFRRSRSRKKSRRGPSQKGEAGEEGEKFLKTEASPKRQRNQIRVLNTGSSRSRALRGRGKEAVIGAHVALEMAPHFQATLGGTTGARKRTDR